MSLRSRFVLPAFVLFSLAFLVGCGSSRTNPIAPPTGAFNDSNLNGTYVFSVVGSDTLGDFQTITGTLTADGNGHLTGGTFDLNNPNNANVNLGLTVGSGSTYNVGKDGRGTATVNVSGGSFGFAFVLTSKDGGGLITEFDGNGTGSGTLELQTSNAIAAGAYTFNFSGTSGTNTSICGDSNGVNNFVIPFATVGTFTLDSNGNVTSGMEDINSNCVSLYGTSGVAITGGSVSVAPATTTLSYAAGTFQFHVYPVDANHLKFIEIDGLPVVAGDVFTQASSIPTNSVFTVAGFDISAFGPFTAAGLFVTDGNGTVTNASAEDINDFSASTLAGAYSEVTGYTGTYTALSGGRSLLTLNGFANGNGGVACAAAPGGCQFAIYPSSGGLQILEVDSLGSTSGIAYTQTGSPTLVSGQGYGVNLGGANLNFGGEEDDTAEFTNTGGALKGIIDFNDQTPSSGTETLTSDQGFTSSYSADNTISGRGTVSANGSNNAYDLVTYGIDSSTSVAIVIDSNMIALGSLATQNATASANAAARHLAVLKLAPHAGRSLKLQRH